MNEKIQVKLKRSGIVITLRCTLKCKLCGGYAPYYKNPLHFTYKEISETIDGYFSLVDNVGDFSITGGETLLHEDLGKIIEKTLEYSDKINRILILTNGTLLFKDEVIEILARNKGKCQVTISNYGSLSSKTEELYNSLVNKGITCRIIKYSGDDLFCDGWVDYGDHSKKHFTQEEVDEQGRKCAVRNRNCNFLIQNGEIHSCGRSYRRMELGIIPKNKEEYVDLIDKSISNSQKRKTLLNIYNSVSSTSCAYCNGLCKDSPRFMPAEQL
jgi:hypothetical protein